MLQAGYQVVDFSMLHAENKPSPWEEFFVHNVDYHDSHGLMSKIKAGVDFIYNAEACAKLNTLLLRERPDIVHFHNIYHQLTPAVIGVAKRFGCKTALTAHDYKIVCPSYTMLRDGHVCEECLTGSVINAFRHRCQQGDTFKVCCYRWKPTGKSSPKITPCSTVSSPQANLCARLCCVSCPTPALK